MRLLPHIEKQPQSELEWFGALVSLTRYLRGPEGCPWDRKQTARSFARFVREEAEELLEAFEQDNESVAEEWGDTFFTLLATAAAAEEQGIFTISNALDRVHEKMVGRHGHIFGDRTAETPEDVVNLWHEAKAREKAGKEAPSSTPGPCPEQQ